MRLSSPIEPRLIRFSRAFSVRSSVAEIDVCRSRVASRPEPKQSMRRECADIDAAGLIAAQHADAASPVVALKIPDVA
jgi:hypothetical protein